MLVLIGCAGSGKTFCGRWLEHRLWEKWEGVEDSIPIFLSLPQVFALEPEEPKQTFIEKALRDKGLEHQEIDLLKKKRVVFFLDGHNQIKNDYKRFNIYKSQKLKAWKKSRFIISTGMCIMDNPENFQCLFSTGRRNFASKLYMVPLSMEKQDACLQKLLALHSHTGELTEEILWQKIAENPHLRQAMQNPRELHTVFNLIRTQDDQGLAAYLRREKKEPEEEKSDVKESENGSPRVSIGMLKNEIVITESGWIYGKSKLSIQNVTPINTLAVIAEGGRAYARKNRPQKFVKIENLAYGSFKPA